MKIVFFDGYCNLCNGLVDRLMKLDQKHVLKFASLQGETAKAMNLGTSEGLDPDTIIYSRDGELFEKSSAILHLLDDLKETTRITKTFSIVPKIFRDAIYTLTAKNRYLLFGKRKTCRIPTEAERSQLIP